MTCRYIIRLDDACHEMDRKKWDMIEDVLDQYSIKPVVAVIPCNKDKSLMYNKHDDNFWNKVKIWENKGWTIGMHGYQHDLKNTNSKSLLPFYEHSEFTGLSLNDQIEIINKSINIFHQQKIKPKIWIAPAHTFDENTLIALKKVTSIKLISDGLAVNPYHYLGFNWIPVQLWTFRKMLFGTWTICLHPNKMTFEEIENLKKSFGKYRNLFTSIKDIEINKKKRNMIDYFFSFIYWFRRRIRS